MVKRFVTFARFKKFETQLRNSQIQLSLLLQRIRELEQAVFDEDEEEEE